jgi:hypothetical protein
MFFFAFFWAFFHSSLAPAVEIETNFSQPSPAFRRLHRFNDTVFIVPLE